MSVSVLDCALTSELPREGHIKSVLTTRARLHKAKQEWERPGAPELVHDSEE